MGALVSRQRSSPGGISEVVTRLHLKMSWPQCAAQIQRRETGAVEMGSEAVVKAGILRTEDLNMVV